MKKYMWKKSVWQTKTGKHRAIEVAIIHTQLWVGFLTCYFAVGFPLLVLPLTLVKCDALQNETTPIILLQYMLKKNRMRKCETGYTEKTMDERERCTQRFMYSLLIFGIGRGTGEPSEIAPSCLALPRRTVQDVVLVQVVNCGGDLPTPILKYSMDSS